MFSYFQGLIGLKGEKGEIGSPGYELLDQNGVKKKTIQKTLIT